MGGIPVSLYLSVEDADVVVARVVSGNSCVFY